MIACLAGLGNPGAKYAMNRHNIGFIALDYLHEHLNCTPWRKRFSAEVSEWLTPKGKVLLVKPMTFMNLSGQAVGEACSFYKIKPCNVTIIHDELDLKPSFIKIKQGGGHGGHNGLKSIDSHIGKDYWRIRVGIGHPGHKDLVANYVLHDFNKADYEWINPFLSILKDNKDLLLDNKKNQLANALNKPRIEQQQSLKKTTEKKPSLKGKHTREFKSDKAPTLLGDQLKKLISSKKDV